MTANAILQELLDCGIDLELTPDGEHLSVQANCLTQSQREQIKTHRHELIDLLKRSEQITEQLIQAAMRACDAFGDGPAEREQMRQDCLNAPMSQREGLINHFRRAYPNKSRE